MDFIVAMDFIMAKLALANPMVPSTPRIFLSLKFRVSQTYRLEQDSGGDN